MTMNEKIDVVYILGKGSVWGDKEIKYSLRSLQKNLTIVRNVFLVGELPKFINTKTIIHIKTKDVSQNKLTNAVHKIRIACQSNKVTNKFILMNDDFFFLKKTNEIPYYCSGTMKQSKRRHSTKRGYYYKAMNRTERMLQNFEIPLPINFEIHYPIIFEKSEFLKIIDKVNWQKEGFLFRSIYCNLMKIDGVYRSDSKLFNIARLDSFRGDFLSTDNRVVVLRKFKQWIHRRFPEVCQYEIDLGPAWLTKKLIHIGGKTYNPGDIVRDKNITKKIIKENKLIRLE